MNKYILSSNYILQKVGDDTVLLPCGSDKEVDLSKMIVLNETGAFIISCLENSYVTLEQLVKCTEQSFENTGENLKNDLTLFLKELNEKGVIVSHED